MAHRFGLNFVQRQGIMSYEWKLEHAEDKETAEQLDAQNGNWTKRRSHFFLKVHYAWHSVKIQSGRSITVWRNQWYLNSSSLWWFFSIRFVLTNERNITHLLNKYLLLNCTKVLCISLFDHIISCFRSPQLPRTYKLSKWPSVN